MTYKKILLAVSILASGAVKAKQTYSAPYEEIFFKNWNGSITTTKCEIDRVAKIYGTDTLDEEGNTLTHYALEAGNPRLVRYVLEKHHACPTKRDVALAESIYNKKKTKMWSELVDQVREAAWKNKPNS